MLTLPIKKKWFDMILDFDKNEEYRELTPYYHSRLSRYVGQKIDLILRNGYSNSSPSMKCTAHVVIGTGQPEWGAEKDKQYYILRILKAELNTKLLEKGQ